MFAKSLKKAWEIVTDPVVEFKKLNNLSFEKVLSEYLHMIITIGCIAGLFELIFNFFKAVYMDVFVHADIQYLRMFNYLFGKANSIFFFTLFFGTFIMFLISVILKQIFRKIRYTSLLKLLFYSLAPLLLFGWTYKLIPGLIVWTLILFYKGVKTNKSVRRERYRKKNSIKQRE